MKKQTSTKPGAIPDPTWRRLSRVERERRRKKPGKPRRKRVERAPEPMGARPGRFTIRIEAPDGGFHEIRSAPAPDRVLFALWMLGRVGDSPPLAVADLPTARLRRAVATFIDEAEAFKETL